MTERPACPDRFLFASFAKRAHVRAIAYVDWVQQEFGIAARLSGDRAMEAANASGDPYRAFAKQARARRTPPPAS